MFAQKNIAMMAEQTDGRHIKMEQRFAVFNKLQCKMQCAWTNKEAAVLVTLGTALQLDFWSLFNLISL